MKCPNCHAVVEKDDMFCPECGSRIESKGKHNKAAVIISLIVLAAIIVGIMFWLLSGKPDAPKDDSKTVSKMQTSEEIAENKSSKDTIAEDSKKDTKLEETEKENKKREEDNDAVKKTESEYVLQQSSSQYLTESDVQGLTAQQLNYAKNEIYARHGRRFDSPELQNYFNSKSWYTGKYDPKDFDANYSDSLLSDVEKKNAEFLKDMEYRLEPSGYQLDQ